MRSRAALLRPNEKAQHEMLSAGLAELLPASIAGRVGAVMFNLGYLPGGDKQRTTQPAGTGLLVRSRRAHPKK